jgi:hypothetical protein
MVETENLLNEMTSPISPALVRAFDHSCVVMAAILPEQCGPAMPFSVGTFHGLSADMPQTVRQFLRRAQDREMYMRRLDSVLNREMYMRRLDSVLRRGSLLFPPPLQPAAALNSPLDWLSGVG